MTQETKETTSLGVAQAKRATRCLCEGAIMLALAQILSYLKFYQAPQGGSITLMMFPILFFSLRWGIKEGLKVGFVFGLMQLIFDGAYAWGWQSMLLDYLVAFTPLGLSGIFYHTEKGKEKGLVAIIPGVALACFARFLVHFYAGVTVYASYAPEDMSVWMYSLAYNGGYMLPSSLVAITAIVAMYAPLTKYFKGEDIAHL